ncbi:hypothetical protein ABPG72_020939 [Tetrahymena utriculariae]
MSSRRIKLFLKIALLLLQLQFLQTKQTCPQISAQSQPHFAEAFYTGGYLKIPNTNILLVNTITYSKAQNIIYYIDISSSIDNMLLVIQPSFPISSIEFVEQRNQILALTTQAVIYVDPYTLEYIETVLQSGFTFNGMSRLKGLNYVIVYDKLHVYVIEIVAGQVITMIDFWAYQQFGFIQSANFLSLQSGQIFAAVFSGAYPLIWSIDVEKNQVTFKGSFSNDCIQLISFVNILLKRSLFLFQAQLLFMVP